jgi:hypothetical protein
MQTRLIAVAAVLLLHPLAALPLDASPQARATPPHGEGRGAPANTGDVSPKLVGSWKSAPSKSPLSTAFDESVWGPNASSVRTVELDVRPSGQAVLTVTTKVVDGRGRVVRGSSAVEEARLMIGKPGETSVAGTEHAVTVVSAERRYPDDPASKWPLEGLKVRLLTREDSPGVELRYDTPEGRGSFWETLAKDVKKVTRPAG